MPKSQASSSTEWQMETIYVWCCSNDHYTVQTYSTNGVSPPQQNGCFWQGWWAVCSSQKWRQIRCGTSYSTVLCLGAKTCCSIVTCSLSYGYLCTYIPDGDIYPYKTTKCCLFVVLVGPQRTEQTGHSPAITRGQSDREPHCLLLDC